MFAISSHATTSIVQSQVEPHLLPAGGILAFPPTHSEPNNHSVISLSLSLLHLISPPPSSSSSLLFIYFSPPKLSSHLMSSHAALQRISSFLKFHSHKLVHFLFCLFFGLRNMVANHTAHRHWRDQPMSCFHFSFALFFHFLRRKPANQIILKHLEPFFFCSHQKLKSFFPAGYTSQCWTSFIMSPVSAAHTRVREFTVRNFLQLIIKVSTGQYGYKVHWPRCYFWELREHNWQTTPMKYRLSNKKSNLVCCCCEQRCRVTYCRAQVQPQLSQPQTGGQAAKSQTEKIQ